jgi:hypothetical protein
MRTPLLGDGVDLTTWSDFIPGIVTAMNERTVKAHGFAPASLILGFDRVHQRFDMSVRDVMIGSHVGASLGPLLDAATAPSGDQPLDQDHRQAAMDHLDRIEEKREAAALNLMHYEKTAAKEKARWDAPKDGDLVLLRRMALDGRKTDKLEARWEGPFRLGDLAHHGRTGRLYDMNTGALVKVKPGGLKDRCHLDDLRVFLPRERSDEYVLAEKWKDCATLSMDKRKISGFWDRVRNDEGIDLRELLALPLCL